MTDVAGQAQKAADITKRVVSVGVVFQTAVVLVTLVAMGLDELSAE